MMLSHQTTFCLPRQVLGRKEGHLKDIGLFEGRACGLVFFGIIWIELGKPLQIVGSDFKSGADQSHCEREPDSLALNLAWCKHTFVVGYKCGDAFDHRSC